MADQKISELTALTGANVADDDAIAIVDTSATETKKIVFSELKNALDTATGFVRITGDTMTGALDVQSTITADGLTVDGTGINALNVDYAVGTSYSASNASNSATARIQNSNGTTGTYAALGFRVGSSDSSIGFTATGTNAGDFFVNTDGGSNGIERLRIANNGDISFYDDTGTTPKFFWDASAESLGIGTSSPSAKLSIAESTVGDLITVTGANGTDLRIGNHASANGGIYINSQAASDDLRFRTQGSDRMTITSSGSVGIGTSSPYHDLQVTDTIKVATGNAQGILALGDGNGTTVNVGLWRGAANAPTTDGNYLNLGGYDGVVFATGAAAIGSQTERMRIDSSGNLLVGKTTIATGTAGIALRSNGEVRGTANGDYAARFSRLSSDGAIVGFEKDNTTVGTIGTTGSRLYAGTGDTGLFFNDQLDSIDPWNTSTNAARDAAIDLGDASRRFKDLYLSGGVKWTEGQVEINSGRLLQRSTGDASGLRFDGSGYTPFKNGSVADGTVDLGYSSGRYNNLYLSGGVYLGGVVGANKLEDYEEGTWTPTLLGASSNPTVGYVLQTGHYTKIGNTVNLYCRLQTNSRSGGSGTALIGGLPFAHNSARAGGSLGYISGVNLSSGYSQFGLSGDTVSSTIRYIQSGDNIGSNIINVTEVASSSNHDIVFTYTYQTDA